MSELEKPDAFQKNVCCSGMQNKLRNAGERGFSVVVRQDDEGRIQLRLQSRGVSYDDFQKFGTGLVKLAFEPADAGITLNYSTEGGFTYCIYCGKPVREMIQERSACPHFRLGMKRKTRHENSTGQ